jgi:gluconokinase
MSVRLANGFVHSILCSMTKHALFVVMGVSGVGKSTLAEALAQRCGGTYLDADAFHPPENVAKMRSGIALTDDDRAGWLARLNAELRRRVAMGETIFLACSALKSSYRNSLAEGLEPTFLFLTAPVGVIRQRMERRTDHYMPASLLDSQFTALEEPADALKLDAQKATAILVEEVCHAFPDVAWH